MAGAVTTTDSTRWEQSACILCENNCGVLLEITPPGGDGRAHIGRIRGDEEHPNSQGYTCQKVRQLDRYQHGPHRLERPLRRRSDGTFEEVDWDTAIAGVAADLAAVRDEHGGRSILYYGGGGQGNHLPGAYAAATRTVLESRTVSTALAQEKTGEFWVDGQLFGSELNHTTGDWEHAEVAVFVGKNPWQSHGVPRARVVLKEIADDPDRTMIVIDPRRTESAEMADIHLRVRPGGDAHLLTAMLAVAVGEDLLDDDFLAERAENAAPLLDAVRDVDVAAYCRRAGVEEALVRRAVRTIAAADSAAFYEDLGIQQNVHSTLNSYLEKALWLLTGKLGRGMHLHSAFTPLWSANSSRRSPVTDTPMLAGLLPCNVVPDEILTDHPERFRALLVESGNPVHSIADSQRMREAMDALDVSVVIDVAMTETARLADWVLPASSQFEKAEATFFTAEYPANQFHLRHAVFEPLGATLPEAEIHRRLVRELGGYDDAAVAPLVEAAAGVDLSQPREDDADGLDAFAMALLGWVGQHGTMARLLPVILYEVLGPRLPDELREGAVVFFLAHQAALGMPEEVGNAGFTGDAPKAGNALFRAILDRRSGTVFADDGRDRSTERLERDDSRVNLEIPLLLDELATLADDLEVTRDPDWPFVLAAGERRAFTANTIYRDPDWRRRDRDGGLRIHPDDAAGIGVDDGDPVLITTHAGSAQGVALLDDGQPSGMVSLPNGLGTDFPTDGDGRVRTGVAPNELTSSDHRDPIAGTPFHKHVPARVERA